MGQMRAVGGATRVVAALWMTLLLASTAWAQVAAVTGTVRDDAGGVLPGVIVEVTQGPGTAARAESDAAGNYRVDGLVPGPAQLTFLLVNFAGARRDIALGTAGVTRLDAVLSLSLSADVTVTGKVTFTNLADAENPAENLLGIAQSASQGAITARQLDARPIMRAGEVLETVPGVVISQHSGEGKANQYLPARLQPRSRHRLRHDGGWHAGEHAHARPRPRLLRSQLPDSRTRERRAVLERAVLCRARRLRHGRRRQHQLREPSGAAARARGWGRPGLRTRARCGVA